MAVVPYPRVLKPGKPLETGKDVFAVQRALRAAGVLKGAVVDSAYAEKTYEGVMEFQRTVGIQATGNYGKPTHVKLAKHFDAYGRWLLAEAVEDLKPDEREKVVNAAWWYYGQRWNIHYSQSRPISTLYYGIRPPNAPRYLDCSGFVISAYWAAGLIAKLGSLNAHGYGNTWSLVRYGTPIELEEARPGDLVFYGNCSHVAIVVNGKPNVLSDGHYPMGYYPARYRHDIWGVRSYLP